jgi:hypothetical protein
VNLDTPIFGLEKHEDHDDVPAVVQEEIVTDNTYNINKTKHLSKKPFRKKNFNTKTKNTVQKTIVLEAKSDFLTINPADIIYEDDLIIGSTESVGSDVESTDIVSNINKNKAKTVKRIRSQKRKVSKKQDKGKQKNATINLLSSPRGRQKKDSLSEDSSTKSPKLQIVLGSGLAVPVSEGEQVVRSVFIT